MEPFVVTANVLVRGAATCAHDQGGPGRGLHGVARRRQAAVVGTPLCLCGLCQSLKPLNGAPLPNAAAGGRRCPSRRQQQEGRMAVKAPRAFPRPPSSRRCRAAGRHARSLPENIFLAIKALCLPEILDASAGRTGGPAGTLGSKKRKQRPARHPTLFARCLPQGTKRPTRHPPR
jgi:hypothetical protein